MFRELRPHGLGQGRGGGNPASYSTQMIFRVPPPNSGLRLLPLVGVPLLRGRGGESSRDLSRPVPLDPSLSMTDDGQANPQIPRGFSREGDGICVAGVIKHNCNQVGAVVLPVARQL